MNEKVTPEELVKALRCSSLPWGGKDETETCKDCPYLTKEEPTAEFMSAANKTDGMIWGCDIDRIALDAADMIEAATEKQKTCPLCHGAYMETEACNFTVAISDIIPMPAINLTTGEKEENARPPFPALIIGNVDEGQDFLPIEFCPFCGRKLK